ncbi:MAG: hypothetical protein HY000_30830 [Planctomycetes bacterium]|nr:hypothetical protein [Planctomycetota bacterium]
MNRADFRQLAEDRVLDADALLAAGRWSGAYYLAGYAVECGLKACILGYIESSGIIFEDKKFAERCWTHDIEQLFVSANLKVARDLAVAANPHFGNNWIVVKAWNESDRYYQKTEAEARSLFAAVTDQVNGMLPWIKVYW